MKLLSYVKNGRPCYGLVTPDGVVNASARLGQKHILRSEMCWSRGGGIIGLASHRG